MLTGMLAFAYGLHGELQNAADAAERSLRLATHAERERVRAAAHFYRGVIRAWRGELAGALADHALALELSRRAGDAFGEYAIRGWRGEALVFAGRAGAAEDDLRRGLLLGERIGTSYQRIAFLALLARALLLQGRGRDALELSACALGGRGAGDDWNRSIALRIRAEILRSAARLAAAELAARTALAIQARQACRFDQVRTLRVLGLVLMERGEPLAADASFSEARALARSMDMAAKEGQTSWTPRLCSMPA